MPATPKITIRSGDKRTNLSQTHARSRVAHSHPSHRHSVPTSGHKNAWQTIPRPGTKQQQQPTFRTTHNMRNSETEQIMQKDVGMSVANCAWFLERRPPTRTVDNRPLANAQPRTASMQAHTSENGSTFSIIVPHNCRANRNGATYHARATKFKRRDCVKN